MANGSLKNKHIAELHKLAAEEGIEKFRMLTRDELIAALGGDADPGAADDDSGSREGDSGQGGGRRRSRGGGGGQGGRGGRGGRQGQGRDQGRDSSRRSRDRDQEDFDGEQDGDEEGAEEGEPVSGVLDITPRGHGFVRLEGLDPAEGDIYVSPSQIRRCELQRGDIVAGPARKPRRGERHPALIHIDTVNGIEPGGDRTSFEDLEPVPPTRRIELTGADASEDNSVLLRSINLLSPLARGQRVLIRSERGSGRTTLLRALAAELSSHEDLEVVVVLVDERPEEEKPWREAAPKAEISAATADMRPGDQLRVAELAIARAKRRAESGTDVVLIFDSLSRLAVAADDPGVVKPIFGAGRETAEEEAGSLTVIATVLTESDDEGVSRILETTENVTISLDGELAAAGVYPALKAGECRVTGEDELLSDDQAAAARELRSELDGLSGSDAAEKLRKKLS